MNLPLVLLRLLAIAAVLFAFPCVASAWLRVPYEDATIVERSELIVVGRLDPDSIQYVPHKKAEQDGVSWERRATLIVTQVLKGTLTEKQIPVVINYGLDPYIDGRPLRTPKEPGDNAAAPPPGKAQVELHDTGTSFRGGPPILLDAQNENLWFLRHLGGELGREAGKGPLGILDPEDVAPLKLKGLFIALLSHDTDAQIDRLLSSVDADVCGRVLRYLSSLHRTQDAPRIEKLLASPDVKIQGLAAQALAEVADVTAVPALRTALTHANPRVRAVACQLLCRFRDTDSIDAIGRVLRALDTEGRAGVIPYLPRMESRKVVDLLLEQLDEHLDPPGPPKWSLPYPVSESAATALQAMTGIEFPLDSAEARKRWERFQGFSDEVLLRKSMLEAIDALEDKENREAPSQAMESLTRPANQDMSMRQAKGVAAQNPTPQSWKTWADENITRSRADWIYAGFAKVGIVLPRPMDKAGIDQLIGVLAFYAADSSGEKTASTKPEWDTSGGSAKAEYFNYNVNWLLERFTGYHTGLLSYWYDMRINPEGMNFKRWSSWWKEHRETARLIPLPEEQPVTREMLDRVPTLRLATPPLTLTIKSKEAVHIYRGGKPLTIVFEVKNTSAQEVLLERRPGDLRYTSKSESGMTGGGTGGLVKEDYVLLKPGQSLTWESAEVVDVDRVTPALSVENLQCELSYRFAGSQFGLRAWRGVLKSNQISCKVEVQ